jgi:hypothetical protein
VERAGDPVLNDLLDAYITRARTYFHALKRLRGRTFGVKIGADLLE